MNKPLLNRITDIGILTTAALSIPMNVIIFFALRHSELLYPRLIPPLLGGGVILLILFRKRIPFVLKARIFIVLMFLAGCFNLLLGLIDLASLWFILVIIYTIIVSQRHEAFWVFAFALLLTVVAGALMMMHLSYFPLKYNFQNCQFPCVGVRILHFLLIGLLSHYILRTFLFALKAEMTNTITTKQKLIEAIVETEENERKRLASDLHDGLGPVLSAAKLYFQAYVDAENPDKDKIRIRVQQIMDDAVAEVSRISHNISPHVLESQGLIAALEHYITPIAKIGAVKIIFDHETVGPYETAAELTLYRCITELITNTLKHSGATAISLVLTNTGNRLAIRYSDNGKGFDINDSNHTGMGLLNIKNRISSCGGALSCESTPGNGMTALMEFPLKRDSR